MNCLSRSRYFIAIVFILALSGSAVAQEKSPPSAADAKSIRKAITKADSGKTLFTALTQAVKLKLKPGTLPVPRREALRGLFGDYLFYDFQPDLFWQHYPKNWSKGMQNVLHHALETNYEHNRLPATCLIPAFFSPKEASELYFPETLKEVHYAARRFDRYVYERSIYQGAHYWVTALWENGNTKRRADLMDIHFAKGILGDYDYYRLNEVARYIPARNWFQENPKEFRRYLIHPKRTVRIYALSYALGTRLSTKTLSVVDFSSTLTQSVLIEGLLDDRIGANESKFAKALKEHATETLPAMRAAFRASTERQQKTILLKILADLHDKPSEQDRMEYLWGTFKHGTRSIWGWGGKGLADQVPSRWAAKGMLREKEISVPFLLKRIHTTQNPRQLVWGLHLIENLSVNIVWDEKMATTILKESQTPRFSQALGMNRAEFDQWVSTENMTDRFLLNTMARYSNSEVLQTRHHRTRNRNLHSLLSLISLGKQGQQMTLNAIKSSQDPTQMAWLLLTVKKMGLTRKIQFDDRMVSVLIEGFADNSERNDLGTCTLAIKEYQGAPGLLERFKRLGANPEDDQSRFAVKILTAYLEGNMKEYLKLKEESLKETDDGKRRSPYWVVRPKYGYWELSLLRLW